MRTLTSEQRLHLIKTCFALIGLSILVQVTQALPKISGEYIPIAALMTALCGIFSLNIYFQKNNWEWRHGEKTMSWEVKIFFLFFLSASIIGIFMLARAF